MSWPQTAEMAPQFKGESGPRDQDILEIAHALQAIGVDFKPVLLLHIADEYTKITPLSSPLNTATLLSIIQDHANLVSFIHLMKMENVHSLTPIFDGKAILVLYECKPGPHLKGILSECLNYQILNPTSTRLQVESYLLENKDKYLMAYAAK